MNPDVVRAVDDLTAKGILPTETAPRLRRIAAGELISVRRELEILLYFGVALIVALTMREKPLIGRSQGPAARSASEPSDSELIAMGH